jgi:hypothetical protein
VEDDGEIVMLVACTNIDTEPAPPSLIEVHLNEDRMFVQLGDKKCGCGACWILDSGTTNHMTGECEAFSKLDTNVHGTVRFGDGSMTSIEGRGTILL